MSQRNYKMLAIVDTNYQCLDQLRNKYETSFNGVISKLLEIAAAEIQEPQQIQEIGVDHQQKVVQVSTREQPIANDVNHLESPEQRGILYECRFTST